MKTQRQAFSKEGTMRMFRLIPILVVLGFFGLPVMPEAVAACTGCCGCTMGCPRVHTCCCPGQSGCATCAAEDFENVEFKSADSEVDSDRIVVRKPMASIATNSRMLDRLIRVGQTGQCAVNKFAMRLLMDQEALSNFDTTFFHSATSQVNTVALR